MAYTGDDPTLTQIIPIFDVPDKEIDQFTDMHLSLTESLLTPGLQTTLKAQSYIHNDPVKNLDAFRGTDLKLILTKPILEKYGIGSEMLVNQVIYRMENRHFINNNVEEFTLHACDRTLLNDAATLVSKLWKCTTPSEVVRYVLSECAGAKNLDIEKSLPARDYHAENIHPFQVVQQQATAALADGDDPSFIHYMTYENFGTHKFRSLKSLTQQAPAMTYKFSERGADGGYQNVDAIMTHMFPCDFDLLSDILNGIGPDGSNLSSVALVNPLLKQFSMFGNKAEGCGIGSSVLRTSMTNFMSANQQNACPDYSRYFLLKRQARMALLEQDKIALRLTVPWTTNLNAGKVIRVELPHKYIQGQLTYGSGDYLIVNMTHNIYKNSISTISMDCVSKTVGQGIV